MPIHRSVSRSFPLRLLSAGAATIAIASASGCTSRTQTFDGCSAERLWPAMVATARTPEYSDWKVMDNHVYANDGEHVIEVFRTLKRTRVQPYSPERQEEKTWKFQIQLEGASDSPTVRFSARQFAVPDHVWREADRYFAQVRGTLEGPAHPAATPAKSSASADTKN